MSGREISDSASIEAVVTAGRGFTKEAADGEAELAQIDKRLAESWREDDDTRVRYLALWEDMKKSVATLNIMLDNISRDFGAFGSASTDARQRSGGALDGLGGTSANPSTAAVAAALGPSGQG